MVLVIESYFSLHQILVEVFRFFFQSDRARSMLISFSNIFRIVALNVVVLLKFYSLSFIVQYSLLCVSQSYCLVSRHGNSGVQNISRFHSMQIWGIQIRLPKRTFFIEVNYGTICTFLTVIQDWFFKSLCTISKARLARFATYVALQIQDGIRPSNYGGI